jgi:hypothetical protein
MEYFVRTSHIVAGMTYLSLFLGWIGTIVAAFLLPDHKQEYAMIMVLDLPLFFLFFLAAFSCLHYIVLKSFHPWAKMPENAED